MPVRQCIRHLLRQYVIQPALRVRFSRRRLALAGLAFAVIFLNKVVLQGSFPAQRPRLEHLRARRGRLLAASLAFRPMPDANNGPARLSPHSQTVWLTRKISPEKIRGDVATTADHILHTTTPVKELMLMRATESHNNASVCSYDNFAALLTSFLSQDCLQVPAAQTWSPKIKASELRNQKNCSDLNGLVVLLWRCWGLPQKPPLVG